MSFDNFVLDAAFLGKRDLDEDQMEAFENGRNLACWFVAVMMIGVLKDSELRDVAAHCLEGGTESFDEFLLKIRITNPGTYDLINLDRNVAKDGYTRALNIFKSVLTDS